MLEELRPELLVKVLKAIKNLSMDLNILVPLQVAGALRRLVPLLGRRSGPNVTVPPGPD